MQMQQIFKISFFCRFSGIILSAVLFYLCDVSSSSAHGVYIYAWVDGATIYTESYFGAKRKVKNGVIKVFDLSGKILLQGKTNEQGEFSFKSPSENDLRIVVNAGMGHQSEYLLKAEEQTCDSIKTQNEHNLSAQQEKPQNISLEDPLILKKIVEETLDKKLKPVMHELAALRKEKRPGFTEILGGVGYIFGIMGILMYMKSRK